MTKKRFELNVNQNNQWDIVDLVESKEKNAICIYNDLGHYYFSSAKALCELLNELNECNNFFIEKTVELIKEYLDVADEQELILFGNAPVERAYALIELLKELGLNDLLKEKGIELLEDDDNV